MGGSAANTIPFWGIRPPEIVLTRLLAPARHLRATDNLYVKGYQRIHRFRPSARLVALPVSAMQALTNIRLSLHLIGWLKS